jgi:hypothetical protein
MYVCVYVNIFPILSKTLSNIVTCAYTYKCIYVCVLYVSSTQEQMYMYMHVIHIHVLQMLIDAGANVHAEDIVGLTPLDDAEGSKFPNVSVLIRHCCVHG